MDYNTEACAAAPVGGDECTAKREYTIVDSMNDLTACLHDIERILEILCSGILGDVPPTISYADIKSLSTNMIHDREVAERMREVMNYLVSNIGLNQ